MSKTVIGWPKVRLGDHIDLLTGFPFKSAQYTEDTNAIRLVRGDNVAQGYLRWEGVKRWNSSELENFSKFKLELGDVILAMDRPWIEAGLKYAWVTNEDIPSLLVQRVSRIRGINGLLTNYLRYIIGSSSFTDYIKPIVTGVAVPHISPDQIKSFTFGLPPLPLQRKIAAVLSAYDDLVEVNTRRIRILEQMTQTVYREWFEKDDAQSLPEGWNVVKIRDITNLYRGRSYLTENLIEEGGVPFLNLKCLARDGGFRPDGLKWYKGIFKESQTAQPGDIIMGLTDMTQERRIVARAARVPQMGVNLFVMSMDLLKLSPKPDIHKTYLYAMLRFSGFADEVKQHANGVNVLHLSPEQIEQYQFALPPKPLRDKFGEFAEPIYLQSDILEKKNANLWRTRDLLLPRLVSGEVGV